LGLGFAKFADHGVWWLGRPSAQWRLKLKNRSLPIHLNITSIGYNKSGEVVTVNTKSDGPMSDQFDIAGAFIDEMIAGGQLSEQEIADYRCDERGAQERAIAGALKNYLSKQSLN
jgi:hypothetical protein